MQVSLLLLLFHSPPPLSLSLSLSLSFSFFTFVKIDEGPDTHPIEAEVYTSSEIKKIFDSITYGNGHFCYFYLYRYYCFYCYLYYFWYDYSQLRQRRECTTNAGDILGPTPMARPPDLASPPPVRHPLCPSVCLQHRWSYSPSADTPQSYRPTSLTPSKRPSMRMWRRSSPIGCHIPDTPSSVSARSLTVLCIPMHTAEPSRNIHRCGQVHGSYDDVCDQSEAVPSPAGHFSGEARHAECEPLCIPTPTLRPQKRHNHCFPS